MARPRSWEHGFGAVTVLCPTGEALTALQDGTITADDYHRLYLRKLRTVPAADVGPERLMGLLTEPSGHGDAFLPVRDGDTLCCACSRTEATLGRCHRVWAAHALGAAGWSIRLDGQPLGPPPARPPRLPFRGDE